MQWRIQGVGPPRHDRPLGTKIFLIFAAFGNICMFAPSPGGSAPPPRGILDMPLICVFCTFQFVLLCFFFVCLFVCLFFTGFLSLSLIIFPDIVLQLPITIANILRHYKQRNGKHETIVNKDP